MERSFEIGEPIEGLDGQFQHDRARWLRPKAEAIIGIAGRMISLSKSGYRRAFPDNLPVYLSTLEIVGQ